MNLQRKGVAALIVLTEPFREVLERVLTYYKPDREVPFFVLPHPTQNLDAEQTENAGRSLAEQFLALRGA